MRNAGRLVMGFYPLPEREAKCLQCSLRFPATAFSALDPCVGDGAAFHALLEGASCHRYGIDCSLSLAESLCLSETVFPGYHVDR